MRKNLILLILFCIISCKPSPTYNAFDDQFDISIREVIKNGCDTVPAGCGFFNLRQKKGRLRNFYQIYVSDWDVVDAKGFSYFLDTIKVAGLKKFNNLDSFKISKKEIENFNAELVKYNYTFLDHNAVNNYDIRIIGKDTKDTLSAQILWKWVNEKDSIIERTIEYWRPKSSLIKKQQTTH